MKMSVADKNVIYAFAKGDESLRDAAIEAHRRNMRTVGVRGNIYQKFMAESDHPVPDLRLRKDYREKLIAEHEAPPPQEIIAPPTSPRPLSSMFGWLSHLFGAKA